MSDDDDNASQDSESTSDSHLACCLCHCAVDYSDKEAFFGYEQESDDDDEKPKPLLLPQSLFDAQNALVLCDSCDRPYHQRCHFIPVISLPRGDWHCLLCKDSEASSKQKQQTLDPEGSIYPFPPKNEQGQVLGNAQKQQEWEFNSSQLKAVAWKREFARLQRALSLQLSNLRLAQDSIRSHTTSSRKSHQLPNPLKSQELCQCYFRLASAKLRIRQWFLSLERVLQCYTGDYDMVEQFVEEHQDQEQYWFPYGRDLERRTTPRCGHDEENNNTTTNSVEGGVPTEVVVNQDDDDDLISLDDLQCCVCLKGDASDENDVILCDGQGCFRAYHMNCVSPHVTLQQVEEEEDWFCPICTNMAKLLGNAQSEYTGDEWQTEDDASTIKSWDHAKDVFPEAELEYEMACKWKDGKVDATVAEFISNSLGMPIENGGTTGNSGGDSQEEDDDDSEDDDFDLDAFENRKREENDEESDASSKATLQDMSDVERNIDRKELDALSLPSDDSSDDEEEEENGRRRTRSTRSSRAASANNSSEDESSSTPKRVDGGTLDESNILMGKRRRSQVDYRRLNDSMFGDVSETASIDDTEEFIDAKNVRRRNSSSSSDESGSDEEESDSDSGSDDDGNESQSGESDKKPTKKTTRTRRANVATKRAPSKRGVNSTKTKKNGTNGNKSSASNRKRRASKQEICEESSSEEEESKPKTIATSPAESSTAGTGSPLVNGKKKRRSKRTKQESLG